MRELYEASLNGCVSTLDTLIKKDPPILSRVSLYPFTETPLHIASLLGHLEFCQILLQNSPNLATELDSKGRCSLHLASAKGHTEVVKALLRTKPEMSLVRDKDEMLPFHFAAIRGRVGAIKELIEEKPNSIQEMIESDDGSVLHLCVRYNHLQALNLLVESLRGEHQFLSAKYKEDSTILLSAVKHRQIKVESPPKKFSITSEQQGHGKWNRFEKFCRTYLLDQGNWIDKKTREQLMVAATVIATMTFQSMISPPGGVWQTDTHKSQDGCSCPN
ncbi:hypothetical protein JHK87_053802 [Glycine soja]|nr:hypothetical protein JHK87_053802 [Glycine soja]